MMHSAHDDTYSRVVLKNYASHKHSLNRERHINIAKQEEQQIERKGQQTTYLVLLS